jgi:hypothetical protein
LKQVINDYLKLDLKRGAMLRVDAPEAYRLQPLIVYELFRIDSFSLHMILRPQQSPPDFALKERTVF